MMWNPDFIGILSISIAGVIVMQRSINGISRGKQRGSWEVNRKRIVQAEIRQRILYVFSFLYTLCI
jgi:hypothetical protein